MARICFFTTELSPVTRGGLGALLWDALHALPAQGHRVTVLADFDAPLVAQFRREHLPSLPDPGAVSVHWLYDLAPMRQDAEFFSPALRHSFAACEALIELVERRREHFDLVEFPDLFGSAYFALVEKQLGRHLRETPVAVRTHGALEHGMSFEAFPGADIETYIIGRLEAYCLRHADWVLCPSQSWAHVCRQRYQIPPERILISPPSLIARDMPDALPSAQPADIILCHGKLQQTKGVDLFIDAAVRLLADLAEPATGDASARPPASLTFVLTGADVHRSPELGSEIAYLYQRIPAALRNRFRFTGHIPRSALSELLGRALFAVIPSRAETYGYAAHELRRAGIPLILNDIPPFAASESERPAFEHGLNCLKFDGTAAGLYQQMKLMASDAKLRARLGEGKTAEDESLGGIYSRNLRPATPKAAAEPVRRITALVVVPPGEQTAAARTLRSLVASEGASVTIWQLRPWTPESDQVPVRMWGRSWLACDARGQPVAPQALHLEQAAILLAAGDQVQGEFLARACQALSRDASIHMVASWHQRDESWAHTPLGRLANAFPWEVIPELAPLARGRLPARAVFRCSPGIALDAWVDERLGPFSETALAWAALERDERLVTIPEPLVRCRAEGLEALRLTSEDAGRLSLLLDVERNRWLQRQLPQLLKLMTVGAAATAGPPTIERLAIIPSHWRRGHETRPQPAPANFFYGKKWLLRQLVREFVRSPLPGFLRRKR